MKVFNRKSEDMRTLLRNGLSNLAPTSGMSQLPDEVFRDNVFYAMWYIYKGYAQRNMSIPDKQSESRYLDMVWSFFDITGVKYFWTTSPVRYSYRHPPGGRTREGLSSPSTSWAVRSMVL